MVVFCQTSTTCLVALVVGDEAALELAVDLGDLVVGRRSSAGLSAGTGMSSTAIVMPPRVAYSKPTVLMPSTRWAVSIGAEGAVAAVDELAEVARFMRLVREAQRVGQDLVEDDPAHGGLDAPLDGLCGLRRPRPGRCTRPARGA